MTEYKQSRKPVNPLAEKTETQQNPLTQFADKDVAAVMGKIKELEKQFPAVDPMSQANGQMEGLPFAVENAPPEFAQLFKKGSRAEQQRQTQESQMQPAPGPRLAYTNNQKLNELLEGIKPTTGTYEEIRLPSLSKFYPNGEAPEGGVLHVRPLTGQEEEIISTQRLLKKGVAINMIFQNCCKENIQPDKWLTADRTYLLIFLRGISMGPIYQVELRCPLCTHRYESNIDLDSLMVKYCPSEFDDQSLKGVLPVTKYKFSFRLPTVKDEQMITNYSEKRKKEIGDSNFSDDTFVWRTALLLEDIEGLNEHPPLMTLIERLPIADVSHLRFMLNDVPFGVDTKIDQWCPGCNEEFSMELPIEASFFFPQPKKASLTRATN